MSRGKFIAFEGGEGAGKSTQVRRLAAFLQSRGIETVATREPGGSPGAEQIRALLVTGELQRWDGMTEALLHFAARSDHLVRTVKPALSRGAWVVCDRFVDSTMAYQGYAQGLGREVVENLTRAVLGDFKPDLTLVLDLPPRIGLRRTDDRGTAENRYERMDPKFHETLRSAFLDIAKREPNRCAVVDASGSEDEVEQAIRAAVTARLGLG